MNNCKLSIITICYNIKDEIERTCKSIVGQTWQDFEWIVVDGGSTDGTLEVLKKYSDRIDILISEKDSGIYNAMNKGIKLANGEWLNFMNGGDNFASNDVLEKVFKNKNYEADILYGDMSYHKNGKIKTIIYPLSLDMKYLFNDCINHQSSFIKRNLFSKYGLYDENYKIIADWEKWVALMTNGCCFLHLDLVVADFYDGGISSNYDKKHIKERCLVWQKYFNICRYYYLFGKIPLLSINDERNIIRDKNGKSKCYNSGV